MHETPFTAQIRLAASTAGCVLFRNNTGVATGRDGRPVRFGLANDSVTLNRNIKSSDLIGWTATGRFLAIEVKRPGWTYKGTDREAAQLRFIQAVQRAGGVAGFVQSVDDLHALLGLSHRS